MEAENDFMLLAEGNRFWRQKEVCRANTFLFLQGIGIRF